MSPEEETNLAVTFRWIELWNNGVDDMIDRTYAKDCVVESMLSGHLLKGREELRALEHQMLKAAPKRRMDLKRIIAAGDVIVVEVVVSGLAPMPIKSCAVLTFKDGLIVSDHSYGAVPPGE